jgi:hypothetical protein
MDFIYKENKLYIYVKDILNKNNLKKLQKRLFYLVEEYNINDIVLDVRNVKKIDENMFYDFLDYYDIKYGGSLLVNNNLKI